ncbi:MAG: Ribonuclease P protein component [uncultured bacterium]|uniref:Ribonuclease P protein component n=1 Tax=Candidatus Magasanikbacteria bacterium RIFOXYD2_FULL_36_9 TaxID=1798707 RepID=A0A1F6NYR0_9BACT|nr:MAG: Ribonuclease P protein component [uncultured bacterium]OGH88960.1 MAG: ribonuclease P protein component [Candidatus Magasanikbacteria bacterium RIFOXYD2_FULL_36_9]
MYNKENHLTKVRDFNLVLKQGCWVNNLFLSLKVLDLAKNESYFPSTGDVDKFKKQLKLAVNVGLKVSKKAVVRNRAKRQIVEVLREMMSRDVIKSGYYLFFVAKPNVKDKSFAEISEEVKVLLKRAKVLGE